MRSQRAQIPAHSFAHSRWGHPRVAAVTSVFLNKAAKHLALLACLMIVGKATGRFTIGEPGIFLLTLFATVAHLFGRALAPRLPAGPIKNLP